MIRESSFLHKAVVTGIPDRRVYTWGMLGLHEWGDEIEWKR